MRCDTAILSHFACYNNTLFAFHMPFNDSHIKLFSFERKMSTIWHRRSDKFHTAAISWSSVLTCSQELSVCPKPSPSPSPILLHLLFRLWSCSFSEEWQVLSGQVWSTLFACLQCSTLYLPVSYLATHGVKRILAPVLGNQRWAESNKQKHLPSQKGHFKYPGCSLTARETSIFRKPFSFFMYHGTLTF